MFSWRWTLVAGIAAGVLITGASILLLQDNLTQFLINPRTPYQTYTPPPPPAYGARGAWALWPSQPEARNADVFYIHSNTYASPRHWNAPLRDAEADATLRRIALPNEAGPFMRIGAVYGPRYRQATLYSAFTHKFDGLAARELAFRDVEKAFTHFLKTRPQGRPFILAGYGQGGLHVLGLLQLHIAGDEALRSQLAAAYVIGEPVPMALFDNQLEAIPPCESPDQAQCVVSYIDIEPGLEDEKRRFRQRALIWDKEGGLISMAYPEILCVNPIGWTISEAPQGAEGHLGAASATGLPIRERPPAITQAIGAQCDNGVLMIDRPRQSFLRRRHWFGDHWRPQDFNLFYYDLAADASRRIHVLQTQQAEAAPKPPAGGG